MKKFFKVFTLIILVFFVFLYFLGSCTSSPEEHNKNDNVEFRKVTPEEYEKEMQDLIGGQASFELFSVGLNAYADNVVDDVKKVYKDFWEMTPAYNIYDYLKRRSELDTINNASGDGHGGGGHYRYPSEDDKSTAIINYEYDVYAKNRVVYSNGTYEIVEIRLLTSEPVNDKSRTGVVKFTRTNQNYSTTSFSFDISLYSISKTFSSNTGEAFIFCYYGLDSYCSGTSSSFYSQYLTKAHYSKFVLSNTNSLKQFNISSASAVDMRYFCYDNWGSSYPNVFSLCSVTTNDYDLSASVDNCTSGNYFDVCNTYYNNFAHDIVNQTNVNNYTQYGYTYNEVTNSIEFDPDIYSAYFESTVKPLINSEFNSIFSVFPEINAKLSDLDINYTNLVDVINEINNQPVVTTSSPSGTYPIVTGDINVDVNVTCPEEFYKKYPTLTTEPTFVADSPDIDYALDEPLPFEILGSAGQFLTMFSDILTDNELMPLYMMCIALSLVAFLLL